MAKSQSLISIDMKTTQDNVAKHITKWEDIDWESFKKWCEENPEPISEEEQPIGSEWVTSVDDKGQVTGTCRRVSKTRYAFSHFDLVS